MLRFAGELEARTADLVELNVLEVGSIRAWAEFLQVGLPMQHFRDMAERVMPQYLVGLHRTLPLFNGRSGPRRAGARSPLSCGRTP
jgi:acyl-CoA reductase-like NAD-dependent aldehyde dehydrogenase